MRVLLIFLFLVSFSYALKINLVNSSVANGKTVLVEFDKTPLFKYDEIEFLDKKYKIYDHPKNPKKTYAFIPVSYYQKPSTKELKINYTLNGKKENSFLMLDVKKGDYKKEKITVSSSKVNPKSQKVKQRISKEYGEAMKIYGTITQKNYIDSKFIMPLNTKITSEFGKARVYNGSLKGFHSGTDFRAKKPTPIKCANDGVVVLAKERFYAGNSIIVDHGRGLYSCYYHLSEFKVKNGERVKKGQVLGLSGSTGRVTGPHLHFSMMLNGVQVDPMQFIELANNNIFK